MNYSAAISELNKIAANELGVAKAKRTSDPELLAWRRKVRWMKKHREKTGCSLFEATAAWKARKA